MDRLAYNVKKADLGDLVQNAEESGAPNGPAASSTSSLVPESSGDASNPGLSGNHIQFDPWDENVFISSTVTTITLKYKINSGVQLNYMLWESWRDGEFSTIANANFKQAKEAAVEEPFQKVTAEYAILNVTEFADEDRLVDPAPMRFLMNWEADSENTLGNTTSDFFAIVDSGTDERPITDAIEKANESEAATEIVSKATATATASKVTDKADATQTSDSSSESSSGSNPEASKGGGGGLGTGAIAGIAVGAVIGVLLIGALAWFFLRKRRQNKKHANGYTATDSGNAYMVDKETHGRTADSPNSPYSDENGVQHIPADNATRDDPASTERALPRTSTSGSQGGRSASGAQTPQGVSTNVAHLVEDGMTADEIRRLEEEERQLDDEIERAARR
ncbi:hypothetical protein EDB81DRAFT_181711 [Dactylonectria macrodidyma]|uniref:Mid2 domain-containing protein n=1 Tax=Dactylonectria macrodidyma TaxID=307937 RepID=A0A9P9JHK3_9HYPO|nr:hypothetical protein EDB81DRAFT_181711 [Dactylonectria macrodidyma]